nr:hypothetical protein BACY1_08390 [Tenacibaculum mesophilum]
MMKKGLKSCIFGFAYNNKYHANNEKDAAITVENLAKSIWGKHWKKPKPEEMIQPVSMITNT